MVEYRTRKLSSLAKKLDTRPFPSEAAFFFLFFFSLPRHSQIVHLAWRTAIYHQEETLATPKHRENITETMTEICVKIHWTMSYPWSFYFISRLYDSIYYFIYLFGVYCNCNASKVVCSRSSRRFVFLAYEQRSFRLRNVRKSCDE